ncbi:MAG: PDZ domain-containing protein [Candidatus Uhrbacteria bacterium]|nr:PDZ domain-containing protein [Candidatus Uhrbacteria bacterium]
MKKLLKSRVVHVVVLSIALGTASGILATAMTNSYLSDYAVQLNQFTHPLQLDAVGPKAFPNSYAEAIAHFSEGSLTSVVSLFPKSAKTTYGFAEDTAIGTGVIVTSDGWIVASALPTASADTLVVQIKDQIFDVTRIVVDPLTQTVFLKCAANNLPVVGFGSAFDLSVGDQLFVSTHVNQFTQASVIQQNWQQGTILSSDVPSRRVILATNMIGASAPAFDLSGSFVGFVSKKDTQFVLFPFENALPSLNALLEKKDVVHPVLGVSYLDLAHTVGISDAMRRGHQTGAYVTGRPAVRKGSPAAVAQIVEGNIITALNGQELDQTRGLNERLLSLHAGDKISLTIDRGGEKKTIDVVLGE